MCYALKYVVIKLGEYHGTRKINKRRTYQISKKIMNCESSEAEVDEMIAILETNVSDPEVTDYIYYDEKTPEEVVDKALACKPVVL